MLQGNNEMPLDSQSSPTAPEQDKYLHNALFLYELRT